MVLSRGWSAKRDARESRERAEVPPESGERRVKGDNTGPDALKGHSVRGQVFGQRSEDREGDEYLADGTQATGRVKPRGGDEPVSPPPGERGADVAEKLERNRFPGCKERNRSETYERSEERGH
jgi:hypothetical protein